MGFITDVSKITNKVNKPTKRVINKTNYNKRHRYEREDKNSGGKRNISSIPTDFSKRKIYFQSWDI